ncbi:alkaline phosphatase family protein [Nannocystaceae bacterium ST9]
MTKKYLDSVRRVLSRRRALQGLGALVGAGLVGCADEPSGEGTDEAGTDTDTGATTGETGDEIGEESSTTTSDSTSDDTSESTTDTDTTDTTETTGDGDGDACTTESDLTLQQLLANVEHIIVLCMENRSFDHYFGARKLVEGLPDVDGLSGGESNLDQQGNAIASYHLTNYTPEDPPHDWDPVHAQWNGGANDGFVIEHQKVHGDSIKQEVMGYHIREDIPVLYALADEYALCDRWFCALLGPTWPNRYYLHCGTSDGKTTNTPPLLGPKTIQDACDDAGISNMNYYGDVPWKWGAFPLLGFAGTDSFDEFFDRLDGGTLEQVVIIDPGFTSNDDHPDHDIQLGQALIATIYQALAQSQYWDKCLFLITYDEHGGFYDHVPPPTVPDSEGPEYQQQGFRVPSLVIGPHVRKGCVVHTVFDHASFPATVCRKFGMAPLNERVAGVADLGSCIDPAKIDDPQPPAPLPKITIDVKNVMARVGVTTSQEELFRATGHWPITPEFTARERARILRLLQRGERLGALQLR